MKKILIIGGSGFVSTNLMKYLPKDWEIFATYNSNIITNKKIKSFKIDLLKNPEEIISIIKNILPDYIVDTVSFPSVDFCEENHSIADKLHIDVTKIISKISNEIS
jgi:dTDP-4-dehydrorhamnose reductase